MLFSELRKDDEKCSDIISNFLEKFFYCDLSDFKRVNDKNDKYKVLMSYSHIMIKNIFVMRNVLLGIGTFKLSV